MKSLRLFTFLLAFNFAFQAEAAKSNLPCKVLLTIIPAVGLSLTTASTLASIAIYLNKGYRFTGKDFIKAVSHSTGFTVLFAYLIYKTWKN